MWPTNSFVFFFFSCMSLFLSIEMERFLTNYKCDKHLSVYRPPLHGLQLCCGKGTWVIQWSYEPSCTGPPKTDRPSEEFWPNVVHRGGNGKPLQYYCLENPMDSMKRQKMWHWKMSPPGRKMSNRLLEKSGGQLLIAPERMKWLSQSGNDAQL